MVFVYVGQDLLGKIVDCVHQVSWARTVTLCAHAKKMVGEGALTMANVCVRTTDSSVQLATSVAKVGLVMNARLSATAKYIATLMDIVCQLVNARVWPDTPVPLAPSARMASLETLVWIHVIETRSVEDMAGVWMMVRVNVMMDFQDPRAIFVPGKLQGKTARSNVTGKRVAMRAAVAVLTAIAIAITASLGQLVSCAMLHFSTPHANPHVRMTSPATAMVFAATMEIVSAMKDLAGRAANGVLQHLAINVKLSAVGTKHAQVMVGAMVRANATVPWAMGDQIVSRIRVTQICLAEVVKKNATTTRRVTATEDATLKVYAPVFTRSSRQDVIFVEFLYLAATATIIVSGILPVLVMGAAMATALAHVLMDIRESLAVIAMRTNTVGRAAVYRVSPTLPARATVAV